MSTKKTRMPPSGAAASHFNQIYGQAITAEQIREELGIVKCATTPINALQREAIVKIELHCLDFQTCIIADGWVLKRLDYFSSSCRQLRR